MRTLPGLPPVLVLDASSRQALAAVRALGRAGIEVAAAGYEGGELAGRSRRCARSHVLPSPQTADDGFAAALDAVVEAYGYGVVVACDDATVARLRITPPRVPCIPDVRRDLDPLVDKRLLADVAAGAGVDYPSTVTLVDDRSLDDAVSSLGLPFVVKSSRSALVVGDRVVDHSGAVIASDMPVLRHAAAQIRELGIDPIGQQLVAREQKIDVALLRRAAQTSVAVAYEVTRDVPLTGGLTVSATTVSPDHGPGRLAIEALERVCDAAGYAGVANGEFCVRRGDGEVVLVEVNPRLWLATWFVERLGSQLTLRAVLHALGRDPGTADGYAVGRRFHHVVGEMRWARLHARTLPRLTELARTTRPWDVFEYDDLADPWPLVRHAFARRRPPG